MGQGWAKVGVSLQESWILFACYIELGFLHVLEDSLPGRVTTALQNPLLRDAIPFVLAEELPRRLARMLLHLRQPLLESAGLRDFEWR